MQRATIEAQIMGNEGGIDSLCANHWKTKVLLPPPHPPQLTFFIKGNLYIYIFIYFLNKHCHFWKQFGILNKKYCINFPSDSWGIRWLNKFIMMGLRNLFVAFLQWFVVKPSTSIPPLWLQSQEELKQSYVHSYYVLIVKHMHECFS